MLRFSLNLNAVLMEFEKKKTFRRIVKVVVTRTLTKEFYYHKKLM